MGILKKYEDQQTQKLTENKKLPDFQPGDTIRVNVKIIEGTNERIQAFEGVCIAKKSRGLNSSFTVRKISHGEGVERIFSTYSPLVDDVKIIRRGDVRRAKLYYMRGLTGKAARIKEKRDVLGASKAEAKEISVATDIPLPDVKEESPSVDKKSESNNKSEKQKAPKAEEKIKKEDK